MKRFNFFCKIFFLGFAIFTKCLGNSPSDQAKISKINDVDIAVISNKSPIKLYACLESIKSYVKGYSKIFVLYFAGNDEFEEAYKNIGEEFPDVTMISCVLDGKNSNFKTMFCNVLRKVKSKYVAITVDEFIVKESFNLNDCVFTFEKSNIYGFCLNVGRDITQDSFVSLKKVKQINKDIMVWNISDSVQDLFTNQFDMVVYNRNVILSTNLRGLTCQTIEDLNDAWGRSIDEKLNMACFCKSKTIKLMPLVLQNNLKENESTKTFLDNKLLHIFNSGFKININTFYGIDNKSSSISYEVFFIPRKDGNEQLWQQLKDKTTKEDKHFVFVIASYNNKQWYKPNLDSVFSQKYKNYSVIYVDDNSPDGTGNLVDLYIKERSLENKILLIKNQERYGAVANIYRAVHMCDDKDIIITLDGDDWLAHDHVLDLLNKIYDDPNIWLTYGQFIRFPNGVNGFCHKFPDDVISNCDYRNYQWCASHLRTFYTWLFKKINTDDFKYEDKFFPMAWDLAIMFPMLEMSGNRFMFIEDVLYVYNFDTPFNDVKTNRDFQLLLDKYIRNMPRYSKIS